MKTIAPIVAVLGLVSPVLGQIYTTTLPWANGDTIVVSQSTDLIGNTLAIETLSTVINGAAGAITGVASSSRSSSSRSSARSTSSTSARKQTQGNQNPVAAPPTSTAPPMTATTYGYMNTDGVWTTGTWVQSYTPPAAVTAEVPAGTILDYNDYQSAANSAVFNAAAGADASAKAKSAADRRALVGISVVLGAGVALGAMLV